MHHNKEKYISWYLVGLAWIVTYMVVLNHKVLFQGVGKVLSIIMPFVFGILFAYLLSGLMKWMENRFKLKRLYAFWLTYILFFAFLMIVVFTVIPLITSNIIDLLANAQKYGNEIYAVVDHSVKKNELLDLLQIEQNVADSIGQISKWAASILDSSLRLIINAILAFVSGIGRFVMTLIISMYVMYDIEGFQQKAGKTFIAVLGEKNANKLFDFAKLSDDIFRKFFIGQSIDALVVGIICFIGLKLIGVPYAVLLSVIVAIFNMIPYLGPFLGGIPVVVIAFLDEPRKALFSILFILVLQQIEGNILAPRILGNTVGISPFCILLAIAFGGGFFGIMGMFLAVPIFKIIQILFDRFVDRRLEHFSKKENHDAT